MCNLSQAIEDRGIQIGFQQGFKEGFKQGYKQGRRECFINVYWSMLNELHWTSEKALDFLKIPVDERESFLKEAQKANNA